MCEKTEKENLNVKKNKKKSLKGRRSGSENLFEINCKKGRVFDLSRDKSNRDSDLRSEKRKKIVFIQIEMH